jgi:Predicted branched-chain amino acid permease (azaleucine resistance)
VSEHKLPTVQPAGFWQGAKDSQAIIFTYLPVSFAFGVSATQFGFTAGKPYFYLALCMQVPVNFSSLRYWEVEHLFG